MISFNKQNVSIDFTYQQLRAIKGFTSYRYKIQQMLNKFQYHDEIQYLQNINKLCQSIYSIIDLGRDLKQKFIKSFKQFLSCQQNIPIQVNFRKLKYEQLSNLIDQWDISLKQPSLIRPSQRLYSIEHRNILFSRIFVQQRQNIEMYFQTLSQKKMLKGVDVYQLLVDIISHYFLYEYSSDNQTFFQKVNSFNNFLQVVEKFIHSERRIIIDNKSKDFQYIKLYEFQALIYFWESINPQLQLRSDKRFSNCSKSIQTQRNQIVQTKQTECQTQKQREKQLNLQQIINLSLKLLNKLTQQESQHQKLEIIQNICESLRKQKIKLLQITNVKSSPLIVQTSDKKGQSSANLRLSSNHPQESRQERQTVNQSQLQLQKTERKSMGSSLNIQQFKNHSYKRQQQQNYLPYKNSGSKIVQASQSLLKNLSSSRKRKAQQSEFSNAQSFNNSNTKQTFSYKKISANKIQNNSEPIQEDQSSKIKNGLLYIKTFDQNETIQLQKNQTQSSFITPSILKLFQVVYQHYCSKTSGFIDIQKLNQFFIDIGIVQENDLSLTLDLIKKKIIKNLNKITILQFLQLMDYIMKQDPDLTYAVISQFVDFYLKAPLHQYHKQIYPAKLINHQQSHKLNQYQMYGLQSRSHINTRNRSQINNKTKSQIDKRNRSRIDTKININTACNQQSHKQDMLSQKNKYQKQYKPLQQQCIKRYSNLRQEDQNLERKKIRNRFKYYEETPKFKNLAETDSFTINYTRYSPNKRVLIPFLNLNRKSKEKTARQ